MMKITISTSAKMMTAMTMQQGMMAVGMAVAGVVMGVGLPVHILIYSNKIIFLYFANYVTIFINLLIKLTKQN